MKQRLVLSVRHSGTNFVGQFLNECNVKCRKLHPETLASDDALLTLCRTHLTVVPLVEPIKTIRSRFTRGHEDWELQVEGWRRVLLTAPENPYYLPIDLISRKPIIERCCWLMLMADHLEFEIPKEILLRWANQWPEHRNDEDRTKGFVPDLKPMSRELEKVKGLSEFLSSHGY